MSTSNQELDTQTTDDSMTMGEQGDDKPEAKLESEAESDPESKTESQQFTDLNISDTVMNN